MSIPLYIKKKSHRSVYLWDFYSLLFPIISQSSGTPRTIAIAHSSYDIVLILNEVYVNPFLYYLYTGLSIIPNITLSARRLNDAGRSRKNLFALLLPGGFFYILYLMLLPTLVEDDVEEPDSSVEREPGSAARFLESMKKLDK